MNRFIKGGLRFSKAVICLIGAIFIVIICTLHLITSIEYCINSSDFGLFKQLESEHNLAVQKTKWFGFRRFTVLYKYMNLRLHLFCITHRISF